MSVEYKWNAFISDSDWEQTRTTKEIRDALDQMMKKSIGDFREALGLPRKASPEEIAAENYCHECGRPYDEDEKP